MPDFIPCTLRALPDEDLVQAASRAVAINSANRPAIEGLAMFDPPLSPEQTALLHSKYWGSKGVRLTVGFLDNAPADLQARIVSHANAWGAYGNVQFVLSSGNAQVRIVRVEDGYWSFLGTDILSIPAGQPTMCLQDFTMRTPESEFCRVVRHEFGHTLGAIHEHLRRELVQRIDRNKAIAYFGRTQGWSPRMVEQQVLTPVEESTIPEATAHADQMSIMCYQIDGSITIDGQPIIGGTDIDSQDQAFIARAYPKDILPPSPPPPPPPGILTMVKGYDSAGRELWTAKV